MDEKTRGAWIIHHARKLDHTTNKTDFENISLAGKAGQLLSALSTNEESTISPEQLAALAQATNISRKLELPTITELLEKHKLIRQSKSEVIILGITSDKVLTHTANLFASGNPSNSETATLEIADKTSEHPLTHKELAEHTSDTLKLDSQTTKELISQANEIGFIDSEALDQQTRLYFNGNIFRREFTQKAAAVLGSLTPEEHRRVGDLDHRLTSEGCVELSIAVNILGQVLFNKLNAIAMYDINEVSNSSERCVFVTRPAAFGKFGNPFTDDALDLAKTFVACLTYGMTRSSRGRGRISMLRRLLEKLIMGDWVGPATAIGDDYKVLELQRVIKTNHEGNKMYSMKLLKREIGQLALEVLTVGQAMEPLDMIPSAPATQYTGPEQNRQERRRKVTSNQRAVAEALLSIRMGSSK